MLRTEAGADAAQPETCCVQDALKLKRQANSAAADKDSLDTQLIRRGQEATLLYQKVWPPAAFVAVPGSGYRVIHAVPSSLMFWQAVPHLEWRLDLKDGPGAESTSSCCVYRYEDGHSHNSCLHKG